MTDALGCRDRSGWVTIVDQNGNRLIGTIGFHTVSMHNRSAEIAFDLAPDYWGRGIGTAMSITVTEWSYSAARHLMGT